MFPRWKTLAFAAICIALCLLQVYLWASRNYMARAQSEGSATLGLVVEAVDQTIGRYQPMPTLIAGDPAFREMLSQGSPAGSAPFLNEKLRQIAIAIVASEVYVLDLAGNTVATSNYRDEDSFLGRNFSFRPYFQDAVEGEVSIFHALGTTSGERGFFFAAPVLDEFDVIGVLAVKIPVGSIEEEWQDLGHDILIADGNGIVFLTSRENYKYRALAPLPATLRQSISDTLQFPLERVVPLELSADVIRPGTIQVSVNEGRGTQDYLAESQPLAFAGWHGIVLSPLDAVHQQVARTLVLGGLSSTAIFLAALVVWQRRANVRQRIAFETQQREMLEAKVQARTADLNAANTNLKLEVAERRHAEERLRKSQKNLIQAGKLAALGQMSAAISHEINQPLGAIKSYAANASEYLARSRIDEARSNVEVIEKMTDRITDISHHLRNFARQPGDKLREIDVGEVIEETIAIVGPQLRSCGASVTFTAPEEPLLAVGGKLRLQQVLVNMVTNALEAMTGDTEPLIEITARAREEVVDITVRDHGPGVPDDHMEQLFDAFYTTKSAGAGMGLGMSISQNIINDFGGRLAVANHAEKGAVFTVTLRHPDGLSGSEVP